LNCETITSKDEDFFELSINIDQVSYSFELSINIDQVSYSFELSINIDQVSNSFELSINIDQVQNSFEIGRLRSILALFLSCLESTFNLKSHIADL
jgi:hypothetical protein